jgi:hypothetical protein
MIGKEGFDPNLLDDSTAIVPNQAGSNSLEIKNDRYERGLRLDSCDGSRSYFNLMM